MEDELTSAYSMTTKEEEQGVDFDRSKNTYPALKGKPRTVFLVHHSLQMYLKKGMKKEYWY